MVNSDGTNRDEPTTSWSRSRQPLVTAMNLRAARVGGQLSFDGATLTNPDLNSGPDATQWTLALQELDAQVLVLRPRTSPD